MMKSTLAPRRRLLGSYAILALLNSVLGA